MSKRWKYRVIKQMRGMNGEYFDFPTAATFAAYADACSYAEEFAREQGASGVNGALIVVRPRRSGGERALYRSRDYLGAA